MHTIVNDYGIQQMLRIIFDNQYSDKYRHCNMIHIIIQSFWSRESPLVPCCPFWVPYMLNHRRPKQTAAVSSLRSVAKSGEFPEPPVVECAKFPTIRDFPPQKLRIQVPCWEVVIFQTEFAIRFIKIMTIVPSIAIRSGKRLKWPAGELGVCVNVSHACKL